MDENDCDGLTSRVGSEMMRESRDNDTWSTSGVKGVVLSPSRSPSSRQIELCMYALLGLLSNIPSLSSPSSFEAYYPNTISAVHLATRPRGYLPPFLQRWPLFRRRHPLARRDPIPSLDRVSILRVKVMLAHTLHRLAQVTLDHQWKNASIAGPKERFHQLFCD